MTKFLTAAATLAVLTLITVSSAFSQISLRKALDTDGDGKADFSVFRPSSNVWYINQSGGGFSIQTFGLANEDFITPGDYDGDGKADIGVWRDTTGVWYHLNSSDSTFSVTPFGITGDEPIARDFDGDGKTDIGIVRRTNGSMVWYILKSQDSSYYVQQFGLSTDYTAPGDYDGDGKFDIAVQRPGTTPSAQSLFYVFQSSNSAGQCGSLGSWQRPSSSW